MATSFVKKLRSLKNPLRLKSSYQNKLYWERLQKELVDEVRHFNALARDFVTGSKRPKIQTNLAQGKTSISKENLLIDGQQVMQSWQERLMHAVVEAIDPSGKNVLEIGYGLGIAAEKIQKLKPQKHTIIECNPDVFNIMQEWSERKILTGADIKLIEGKWQDTLPKLRKYESILFDPYPFDEEEFQKYWYDEGNFDLHFFPHAAKHLVKGGAFSYFTNEVDSLSRKHQRALLNHFSSFKVTVIRDLKPPKNCQYWWSPHIAVVQAIK